MPDFDFRTWLIIGLAAALLGVILAVPMLRENLATWLVWLGGLLGAGVHESGRKANEKPPEPEPVDDADQAQQVTDEAAEQEQEPSGDELVDDLNELTSEVE